MTYDVWICCVGVRRTYRTTLAGEVPVDEKPPWAIEHLDTVHAANRRQAVGIAMRRNEIKGRKVRE